MYIILSIIICFNVKLYVRTILQCITRSCVNYVHVIPPTVLYVIHVHRMQVLLMNNQIDPLELDFLLRFPAVPNMTSPVDFISNFCWGGIKALSNLDQFKNLDRDIEVCTLYRTGKFFYICF